MWIIHSVIHSVYTAFGGIFAINVDDVDWNIYLSIIIYIPFILSKI